MLGGQRRERLVDLGAGVPAVQRKMQHRPPHSPRHDVLRPCGKVWILEVVDAGASRRQGVRPERSRTVRCSRSGLTVPIPLAPRVPALPSHLDLGALELAQAPVTSILELSTRILLGPELLNPGPAQRVCGTRAGGRVERRTERPHSPPDTPHRARARARARRASPEIARSPSPGRPHVRNQAAGPAAPSATWRARDAPSSSASSSSPESSSSSESSGAGSGPEMALRRASTAACTRSAARRTAVVRAAAARSRASRAQHAAMVGSSSSSGAPAGGSAQHALVRSIASAGCGRQRSRPLRSHLSFPVDVWRAESLRAAPPPPPTSSPARAPRRATEALRSRGRARSVSRATTLGRRDAPRRGSVGHPTWQRDLQALLSPRRRLCAAPRWWHSASRPCDAPWGPVRCSALRVAMPRHPRSPGSRFDQSRDLARLHRRLPRLAQMPRAPRTPAAPRSASRRVSRTPLA